jgi:uncharacterized protein
MEYQESTPGVPREGQGQPKEIRDIREIREARAARGSAPVSIYLQPIASPWGVGLSSLAIASFFIGAYYAHWYGTNLTPALLFPFVLIFGGIIPLIASVWMFRARDVLGTVALGVWGAFWLGVGLFTWVYGSQRAAFGPISLLGDFTFLSFALAAITLSTAIAALGENVGLFATLISLTTAAVLLGLAQALGSLPLLGTAGYVFVLSSVFGWYTATALMLSTTMEREVLPLGRFSAATESPAVEDGAGEPGVSRHHRPGYYYEKGREAKASG